MFLSSLVLLYKGGIMSVIYLLLVFWLKKILKNIPKSISAQGQSTSKNYKPLVEKTLPPLGVEQDHSK